MHRDNGFLKTDMSIVVKTIVRSPKNGELYIVRYNIYISVIFLIFHFNQLAFIDRVVSHDISGITAAKSFYYDYKIRTCDQ